MSNHTSPAATRAGTTMLTVEQVAEQLAVSEKSVRRYIADHKLVAHHIGRSIRIAMDDLRLFLSQHRG